VAFHPANPACAAATAFAAVAASASVTCPTTSRSIGDSTGRVAPAALPSISGTALASIGTLWVISLSSAASAARLPNSTPKEFSRAGR